MAKRMIHNADDLERTVLDLGFLPFFKNSIEGRTDLARIVV